MIEKRTYFLEVIYECFITLKHVDNHWNRQPLDERFYPQTCKMNFEQVLKDLILTIPQMSKLAAIKAAR